MSFSLDRLSVWYENFISVWEKQQKQKKKHTEVQDIVNTCIYPSRKESLSDQRSRDRCIEQQRTSIGCIFSSQRDTQRTFVTRAYHRYLFY